MGKLLCLVALGLALSPPARAQQRRPDAAPPPATCDEMRARLREDVARAGYKNPETMGRFYEAAKKFVTVCGREPNDRFALYVARWVEKYEAAVREFEAGRAGGALGAAAGAGLAKGLTGEQ